MRQSIVFFIVLLLVILFGFWELSYLDESSKYFMSDINNTYQTAMRGEYSVAENEGKNIKEMWKNLRKTWALFINDGEIDRIDESITSFVSCIKTQSDDDIVKEYYVLISQIKHAVEFQKVKVENVF